MIYSLYEMIRGKEACYGRVLLQSLGVNQLETKLKSAERAHRCRLLLSLLKEFLFPHLDSLYGTVLGPGHKGCTLSIRGHTPQAINMYCQEIS